MRRFVLPGTSIHYYVVDFSSDELPWADFRGRVLGPTVNYYYYYYYYYYYLEAPTSSPGPTSAAGSSGPR